MTLNFIDVVPTEAMRVSAEEYRQCILSEGAKERESGHPKKGWYLGKMLELATLSVIPNTKSMDTRHFDILFNAQIKIECKNKARSRSTKPLGDYIVNYPYRGKLQEADILLFGSLDYQDEVQWILGYLPKKEFFAKSKEFHKREGLSWPLKKGEPDTSGGGHLISKEDHFILSIDQLYDPHTLLRLAERRR